MSYSGLCELVASRGWAIVLLVEHSGARMQHRDEEAQLAALAIYESRGEWKNSGIPLATVKLHQRSLDQAAEIIMGELQAAGAV